MHISKLMLAVLIASTCGAAAADSGLVIKAGFSNVQLNVFDLAPHDGQAASYTVDSYKTTYFYGLNSTAPGGSRQYYEGSTEGIGPQQFDTSFGNASAQFGFTGFGAMQSNATALSDVGEGGGAHALGRVVATITLSPHSALSLSGLVTTSADWQDARYVTGNGHLEARVFIGEGYAWSITNKLEHYSQFWDKSREENWSKDFWFAYANQTDSDMTITVDMSANASATIYTLAPVPEPSSWAMLGAGLGLLGLIGRRKQRQGAVHRSLLQSSKA